MKRTARKSQFTGRPEIMDFINHHEETELEPSYHNFHHSSRGFPPRGRGSFRHGQRGRHHEGSWRGNKSQNRSRNFDPEMENRNRYGYHSEENFRISNNTGMREYEYDRNSRNRPDNRQRVDDRVNYGYGKIYEYSKVGLKDGRRKEGSQRNDSREMYRDRHSSRDRSRSSHREETRSHRQKDKNSRHESKHRHDQKQNGSNDCSQRHHGKRSSSRESRQRSRSRGSKKRNKIKENRSKSRETASEISQSSQDGSPIRSWKNERNTKSSFRMSEKVETKSAQETCPSESDDLNMAINESNTIDDERKSEKSDDEILSMSSTEMRSDGTSPYTSGDGNEVSVELRQNILSKVDKQGNGKTKSDESVKDVNKYHTTVALKKTRMEKTNSVEIVKEDINSLNSQNKRDLDEKNSRDKSYLDEKKTDNIEAESSKMETEKCKEATEKSFVNRTCSKNISDKNCGPVLYKNEDTRVLRNISNDKSDSSSESKNSNTANINVLHSNESVSSKSEEINCDVVGRILNDKNYSSISESSSKDVVKSKRKSQDLNEKEGANTVGDTETTKLKPDKGKGLETDESSNVIYGPTTAPGISINSRSCSETPTKSLNPSFSISTTTIYNSKPLVRHKIEKSKIEFKQSGPKQHITSDTGIDSVTTSGKGNSFKPKQSTDDDGQSQSELVDAVSQIKKETYSERQTNMKLNFNDFSNTGKSVDGDLVGQIIKEVERVNFKTRKERLGSKDCISLKNGGKTNDKNTPKSVFLTSTTSSVGCKNEKQAESKQHIASDSSKDTTSERGNSVNHKQFKDGNGQSQSAIRNAVNEKTGHLDRQSSIKSTSNKFYNTGKTVFGDLVGQIIKEGERVSVKTRTERRGSKDSASLKTGENQNDKNTSKSGFLTSTPSKSLKSDLRKQAKVGKENLKIAEELPTTREERKTNNHREIIHDKDLNLINDTLVGNDTWSTGEMPSFQQVCLDKSQTVSERVHKYEETIDKGINTEILFSKNRPRKSHVPEAVTCKPHKEINKDDKLVSKVNVPITSTRSEKAPTRTNIFESLGSHLCKSADENNTKSSDHAQAKKNRIALQTDIVPEGKLPVGRAAKLDLRDKPLQQSYHSGEDCQKDGQKRDVMQVIGAKTETFRNEKVEKSEDMTVKKSKPVSHSEVELQEKITKQDEINKTSRRDERLSVDRADETKDFKDKTPKLITNCDSEHKKLIIFNQEKETLMEEELSPVDKSSENKRKKSCVINNLSSDSRQEKDSSVINEDYMKENYTNKLSVGRIESSDVNVRTHEQAGRSAGSEEETYNDRNKETKTESVSNCSLSIERMECSKDIGQKETFSNGNKLTQPENGKDKLLVNIVDSSGDDKDPREVITQSEAKLQTTVSNQTPKSLPLEDEKCGNNEKSVSQETKQVYKIDSSKKGGHNQKPNKTISGASHFNLPPVVSSVTNRLYSKTDKKIRMKRNSTEISTNINREFPTRNSVDQPEGSQNSCGMQCNKDVNASTIDCRKDVEIKDNSQKATYINDEDLDEEDFRLIEIAPYTPHPRTGQVESGNEAVYSDISDAETEIGIQNKPCNLSMKYLDDRVFVGASDKNVCVTSEDTISSGQVGNHNIQTLGSKDIEEDTLQDEIGKSVSRGETNPNIKRKSSLNGIDMEEIAGKRKKVKINDEIQEPLHDSEISNDTGSHTPAKSESLKDYSVRKHLKYIPESPLKTPKKTNYGKRLANASKGFDDPVSPEITCVNSNMKTKHSEVGKLKRKHSKDQIRSGTTVEGLKSETPIKKKKTELPNGDETTTNRRNKMKKDLETVKMTIKVPTNGDKKDRRYAEQLKQSSVDFDVSVSCDMNENELEEELDKPPVQLRSGSLESTAPVLINGFDIIHTLTLKDLKRVTTSGHLDPQKLNAGERCLKCDICNNYFSPLEFTSHHDSGDIIPKIDGESSMRNSFDAKPPDILHWNENALKIWEKFQELFEREKRKPATKEPQQLKVVKATCKENDGKEVKTDDGSKDGPLVAEDVRKKHNLDTVSPDALVSLSSCETSYSKTETVKNAKARAKRAKSLSGPAVQQGTVLQLQNGQGEQPPLTLQQNQYDPQITSTTHKRRHSGSSVVGQNTNISTILPCQILQPQPQPVFIPIQQCMISNAAPVTSGYTNTLTEQAYSQSSYPVLQNDVQKLSCDTQTEVAPVKTITTPAPSVNRQEKVNKSDRNILFTPAQFSGSSSSFSHSTSNLPNADHHVSVPIINGSTSINTSTRNIAVSSTPCSSSSSTVSLASSNHVIAQTSKAPSPILDASLLSEDELLCALQRKFSLNISDNDLSNLFLGNKLQLRSQLRLIQRRAQALAGREIQLDQERRENTMLRKQKEQIEENLRESKEVERRIEQRLKDRKLPF